MSLSDETNVKTTWEELKLNFNFAKRLATGETVTGVDSVNVIDPAGTTLVASGVVLATPKVQALYTGGTDLEDCTIRCRVLTSTGEKKELRGVLHIRNSA